MTLKRSPLATDEFYHVYNKSIAKENIFIELNYLNKILDIVDYYRFNQRIKLSRYNNLPKLLQQAYINEFKQTKPLVDVYSFSFMPNHFHFSLKQLTDNGIKKFLSNIQNSFAKFFNLIKDRNGSLFINSFKYKRIINKEVFIHICRYIHINHVSSRLIEFNQLSSYPYSSYPWYLKKNLNRFINTKPLMNHFKSTEKFIKFHQNQVGYQRKLEEIKDFLLE